MNERALQQWVYFLAEKINELDALHVAVTGRPHVASVELVAFLKMNNELVRERVERAILELAETKVLPIWLKGDEIVNLTHRAFAGRGTLQAILHRQMSLRTPPPNSAIRFLRWL